MWREASDGSQMDADKAAEEFIHEVLQVEKADFDYASQVEKTRKIRTGRMGNTRWEILVVFQDIDTRDFVHSHARHLSAHVNGKGKRTAGIKMEIPVHLLSTFKVLEKHGHILRQKYGAQLRRQIMYDDDNQSLYLDVKPAQDAQWERVTPETANAERMRREEKERRRERRERKQRITSTVESDTEEEGNSGTDMDEDEAEEEDGGAPGTRGTKDETGKFKGCLLYTSPSPRDS